MSQTNSNNIDLLGRLNLQNKEWIVLGTFFFEILPFVLEFIKMNSSVALNKFRWQLQSVRLSLEREIKIRASQAGEAQRPKTIL